MPREVVWWALRHLGVDEWLVLGIKAMYEDASTKLRMNGRESRAFNVKIGVHQGSVLSPLLFIIVIVIVIVNRHLKNATPNKCSSRRRPQQLSKKKKIDNEKNIGIRQDTTVTRQSILKKKRFQVFLENGQRLVQDSESTGEIVPSSWAGVEKSSRPDCFCSCTWKEQGVRAC